MRINGKEYGSFRDPSGYVFYHNGEIYRQVNHGYKENYDYLISSKLYDTLISKGLLIPHREVDIPGPEHENAYKIIRPEKVPFISYPFEWCYSQLKDAALVTLALHKTALEYGMWLKDASAYNIQFLNGKPILIDTLSFEVYPEEEPWVAYRQYCQHFLAPLALMSLKDIRLNQLLRIYIDGVPLDLASKLLPFRSLFSLSLLSHIHAHARTQKYFAHRIRNRKKRKMSRVGMLGIIDNLEKIVEKLKWRNFDTEWNDYYEKNIYTNGAFHEKQKIVSEFLDKLQPRKVWDMGANTGVFSRIAAGKGIPTISFDIDPACVENNYLKVKSDSDRNLLPLMLDLTNPSPNLGWQNNERKSVIERGPADTVIALALVHHLSISNNIPLDLLALFFLKIGHSLIIEFIPKSDPQVQILLASRQDIFPRYDQENFEKSFHHYFHIEDAVKIHQTQRVVYRMVSREGQDY